MMRQSRRATAGTEAAKSLSDCSSEPCSRRRLPTRYRRLHWRVITLRPRRLSPEAPNWSTSKKFSFTGWSFAFSLAEVAGAQQQ